MNSVHLAGSRATIDTLRLRPRCIYSQSITLSRDTIFHSLTESFLVLGADFVSNTVQYSFNLWPFSSGSGEFCGAGQLMFSGTMELFCIHRFQSCIPEQLGVPEMIVSPNIEHTNLTD
eukprot:sb/3476381/